MPENLTPNAWDNYLPSSSEKKQAVLMYLFVGLLLSLQQQNVSPYMHHHIRQAFGRIVLLVLVLFLDAILAVFGVVFGKFFSILAGIITIPVLVLGVVCVKQARDGKYQWKEEGSMKFFALFSGL
jgi:predicted tellurium resistance membrane protein TerC